MFEDDQCALELGIKILTDATFVGKDPAKLHHIISVILWSCIHRSSY
jgi:hypothetical protein